MQRVHNAAVARLQIIIGESRGSGVQVHDGALLVDASQAILACLLLSHQA